MFHHKKSSRQSFTGDENGEKIDSPNNPPDSTTPNDLSAGTASIMPIGSNYVLWVLEEFPRVCFKSPATGKFIGKSKRRGKHKEKRLSAVHVPTSFLNSQSSPAEIFQIIQVGMLNGWIATNDLFFCKSKTNPDPTLCLLNQA